MNETILGKISSVKFGVSDGRFGLWMTLDGSWSVCINETAWSPSSIEVTEYTKWTEEDRAKELSKIMYKIDELLHLAKVDDVYKLNGIPVEFTSKNGMIDNWRILTEVL